MRAAWYTFNWGTYILYDSGTFSDVRPLNEYYTDVFVFCFIVIKIEIIRSGKTLALIWIGYRSAAWTIIVDVNFPSSTYIWRFNIHFSVEYYFFAPSPTLVRRYVWEIGIRRDLGMSKHCKMGLHFIIYTSNCPKVDDSKNVLFSTSPCEFRFYGNKIYTRCRAP